MVKWKTSKLYVWFYCICGEIKKNATDFQYLYNPSVLPPPSSLLLLEMQTNHHFSHKTYTHRMNSFTWVHLYTFVYFMLFFLLPSLSTIYIDGLWEPRAGSLTSNKTWKELTLVCVTCKKITVLPCNIFV